jgi:hypothetical protein
MRSTAAGTARRKIPLPIKPLSQYIHDLQWCMTRSTPLAVATNNRNYKLGMMLMEYGADVNMTNKAGWLPRSACREYDAWLCASWSVGVLG